MPSCVPLEHFPAKWKPVRRRKCDYQRRTGANSDSTGTEFALMGYGSMDDQRTDGGGQEDGEYDAEQPQNKQQSIDAGNLCFVDHRLDRQLEK
jgi:hypothetical protein